MNKKIKSLMLVASSLLVGACSNATIDEERTIILEVNSDVIPTFTSNFGDGSYDSSTNKYTHKISSIKDLYITLSHDDLKSITVHIPTIEMQQATIIKEVEFGDELDAEIEITVEGVKTLEGLNIVNSENIKNLKIGDRNKFKFTLPSREEDYTLNFTLPGYKDFEVKITEDDLISGMANISTIALNIDQAYIALDGSGYSYKIYASSTNKLIASGSKDNYDSNREYIILENTDSYYAYTYNYNTGKENLYKVNANDDFIIKENSGSYNYNGYLNLTLNDEPYHYSYAIYDKINNRFTGSSIYNNISYLGLVVKNKENEWYYFDEITTTHENEDTYTQYFELDFSKAVPVDFKVKRIHSFTNEIISDEIEDHFYTYDHYDSLYFENNVFNVTVYENEGGKMNINLYDQDDNLIHVLPVDIDSYFNGEILSGRIDKIPYQFPLFKEDVQYNNGNFTYTGKVNINTDISLMEIIYINEFGYSSGLNQSSYIMAPDGTPILKTDLDDGKSYFELEANLAYTLYNDNQSFDFTLSNSDIERGQIVIFDQKLSSLRVKVEDGYHLILSNQIDLYPDSNGIINFPYNNKESQVEFNLSNGDVSIRFNKQINGNETIELGAFYAIDLGNYETIYDDTGYNLYYSYSEKDNKYYYYIDWLTNSTSIKTSLHLNENYYEYVYLDVEDFSYDSSKKANYYSFIEEASHILLGSAHYLNITNYIYYDGYYYLFSDSVVEYNGNTYDLSTYSSKYLNVDFEYNEGYYPTFTPVNN